MIVKNTQNLLHQSYDALSQVCLGLLHMSMLILSSQWVLAKKAVAYVCVAVSLSSKFWMY